MANQSSAHPILCASFNQDNSCFAIGTKDGFKIFDCNTGRLLYERAIGAFIIVEMLYRTSLLAIVGAGEQPSLSPRRLCLFNTVNGTSLRELNFLTSILAVRVDRKRLIVLFKEQTYIYDVNSLEIKQIIDTVPNVQGLCAFSASMDNPYLALPASITKGSVLVYNVVDLQSHCEIDAHRSPLIAMAFSSNGTYIATASEHGTIIRVHLISDATKSYSFRRGTYSSTIFSLSFGPSADLPDILLATSSSGSVHIFSLGFDLNERSKKSSSLLGSIIPGSVSDALDPAHHLVFHHAFAAGVRSDAVVRKIEKASGTSMSEPVVLRATISMISFSGYFQEYSFRINHKNEATWTLEHEFNLLTAVAE
ncbi:autophagy-related protein 18b isoform X1 [Salvia miltiorrhiza]|uniref:autophagy-related protein 18b isoform X1 n=1 Tax=Salvia miltiorrhiza TaxID=226208 RepID=UPI0025AB954D|nr:autophagy-related protein 18b isoform X1 [Salvia miltiorrhiza]